MSSMTNPDPITFLQERIQRRINDLHGQRLNAKSPEVCEVLDTLLLLLHDAKDVLRLRRGEDVDEASTAEGAEEGSPTQAE